MFPEAQRCVQNTRDLLLQNKRNRIYLIKKQAIISLQNTVQTALLDYYKMRDAENVTFISGYCISIELSIHTRAHTNFLHSPSEAGLITVSWFQQLSCSWPQYNSLCNKKTSTCAKFKAALSRCNSCRVDDVAPLNTGSEFGPPNGSCFQQSLNSHRSTLL